jgi:hypothetical protein
VNASLICNLCNRQCRRDVNTSFGLAYSNKPNIIMFIPTVNSKNEPLMPTSPSRARKWIRSGKVTPFWKKGIFCVRLNIKTKEYKQKIAVGIDPGSKKEGFTIKSQAHTFLNIQADAVTWVKDAVEIRRNTRKARRQRKCPYRKPRFNKAKGGLSPSTKARWQWKLRILSWLYKLFPVSHVIVEDIKAKTTGKKNWDKSFTQLEVGKFWFYSQIPNLILKLGYETKELRDSLGLKKSKNKLSNDFSAHCVDSWVLANFIVGGHTVPGNKKILYLKPLRFHRRQLHVLKPSVGGIRKKYGGTMSLGLKRGSLVKHKGKLYYVGGTSKGKISLHDISNGERLGRSFKIEDCKFLCYNSWTFK